MNRDLTMILRLNVGGTRAGRVNGSNLGQGRKSEIGPEQHH